MTDSADTKDYSAVVEFRNAYGELPAAQIPKLPFYGGITILYFFVAVFWGFLYYQHHSDICKMLSRHDMSIMLAANYFHSGGPELHYSDLDIPRHRDADDLGFLRCVLKQSDTSRHILTQWADYLNRNGSNVGSKVLLVIVGVLNAARNSFSFFLLLIVCMGYGVVKPTLGRTMIYVRWLAIAHFIFGLVYAITSLVITPDTAGKRDTIDQNEGIS